MPNPNLQRKMIKKYGTIELYRYATLYIKQRTLTLNTLHITTNATPYNSFYPIYFLSIGGFRPQTPALSIVVNNCVPVKFNLAKSTSSLGKVSAIVANQSPLTFGFDDVNGVMTCSVCQQFSRDKDKNAFVKGTTFLRVDGIKAHEVSESHSGNQS
ncbi:hypothetical protein DPMN_140652 [Dreissena polymorpha]|uniref:C17orf113 probable zinc finger domain-containing protein n=1 Tax=Dreissena polymorpha TaxID=45954 RepID=A0A9D4G844_DREPO|nr:hypothetical protein DPMN_140652 [Dreissena polymorpha]